VLLLLLLCAWNGLWQDLAFEHFFIHARVSYALMMPSMCSTQCWVRRVRACGRVRACRPSRQIADRPRTTFEPVFGILILARQRLRFSVSPLAHGAHGVLAYPTSPAPLPHLSICWFV
jgi:hypothetical protein